jgi:hypothetical protein
MLGALVSRTGFDEVNQAFRMADPSHPFFSLSESALRAIAYGSQLEAFPRIRVPFLFNRIALPDSLDPYNAYLFGKNCSESLLMRAMDTPLIGQIANRFIGPDHGLIILQNHSHLAECADPSVDHFPIFQLYPGRERLTFPTDFVGLTFWFKSNEVLQMETIVARVNCASLTLCGNELTLRYEQQMATAVIDSVNWTFVAVILTKTRINSEIQVIVNKHLSTFKAPLMAKLKSAWFGG